MLTLNVFVKLQRSYGVSNDSEEASDAEYQAVHGIVSNAHN